jgi:hypothetical protein
VGRIERGGGGVAANPLGAHQVGRGFADRVTAHLVTIFAGVPRVSVARHACLTSSLFSPIQDLHQQTPKITQYFD